MANESFFVSQTSSNDCGAACLTMILRLNNINVNLNEIKNKLKIEKDGISALEIVNLAKKYGFDASGYKNMELDSVNSIFIAHLIKDKVQHFVVVLKVLKDKVLIADPAKSVLYIDKDEFKKNYTKIALVFKKNNQLYKKILLNNKKLIFKILLLTLSFTLFCISYSYMFSFILSININKKIKLTLLIIVFLLGFFKDLFNYVRQKLSFKLQILTDKILTLTMVNKFIDLPDSYYQNNAVGSLMSKLNDLSYVKDMISNIISSLFINCFLILSILIITSFMNIYLLLFNISFIMVLYFLNKKFLKYSIYDTHELQLKNEHLNKFITECLSLIQLVKNLSKESYYKNKIEKKYNTYIMKYKKLFNFYNKKNFIMSIIFNLYIIILCFFLIYSGVNLTSIIFIYNLENIIIDSLNSIFDFSILYANFKSSIKRLKDINLYEKENNINNIIIKNISFNHVYFKYKDKFILKDFSLDINEGDFIMINGKSGIGKSTIFKILLKKVDYHGNNILVNGKKLKNISINDIRRNIIYLDQKTKLFNDTVKENIFMGNNYDEKLLKMMNLNNNLFLENNIDNINSNISSGQIGKIAICQALLTNKKIIILDEVTSALDIKEERIILSNIKNNYKCTIIVITHRKSNKDIYNKIITL